MKYIPYVLILAFCMLVLTAFVVDQGGLIEARQEAQSIAQGAARAGTNAAGGTAIDGDAFELAGPTAIQAAQNYLDAASDDFTGTATLVDGPDGQQIIVTARKTYNTRMAYWVGISQLEASGTAAARLIDG